MKAKTIFQVGFTIIAFLSASIVGAIDAQAATSTKRSTTTVTPTTPTVTEPTAATSAASSKVSLDELLGKTEPGESSSAVTTTTTPATTTTSSSKKTATSKTSSSAVTTLSATAASSSTGSTASPQNIHNNFNVDPYSGASSFSLPIFTPAGRKGVQPSVVVSYSHRGGNDILGVGWDVSLGSIERSVKFGVPTYGSTDTFMCNLGGSASELVSIGSNEYRAKIEGGFMKFTFDGTNWTAKDKEGNTYYFALNTVLNDASRVASGSNVFRWYLSEIKDIHGNYLFIKRIADGSFELYYTGEPGTDRDTFGSSTQKFLARITTVMETTTRPDPIISYRSGFQIAREKRLQGIEVYAGGNLMKKYAFAYAASPATGRSLLTSVTEYGADGASTMPTVTFGYTDDMPTYAMNSITGDPVSGDNIWNFRYSSFDNGPSNFGPQPPSSIGSLLETYTQLAGTVVKGDGTLSWNSRTKANVTFSSPRDYGNYFYAYVFANQATTLSVPFTYGNGAPGVWLNGAYASSVGTSWPLKAGYNLVEITDYDQSSSLTFNLNYALADHVALVNSAQVVFPQLSGDFNGDGFADVATFYKTEGKVKVALSNGTTFLPKETWIENFALNMDVILGDFNADGKTDIASFSASTGNWQVALSTGTAFSTPTTYLTNFGNTAVGSTGDFNGDGYTDIVYYRALPSNGDIYLKTALNNRAGQFVPQGAEFKVASSGSIVFGADFNGDGLTDFGAFNRSTGTWNFYRNPGNIANAFIALTNVTSFGTSKTMVVSDFNSDGLTDIGYYDYTTGVIYYRANNGNGFSATTAIVAITFTLREEGVQVQTSDFNADGITDYIAYNALGNSETAFSIGTPVDLLETINNNIGATTTVAYTPSSAFPNMQMPFSMPVVSSVTVSTAQGDSYTTRYAYNKGVWNVADREFWGFEKVRIIDVDNNYTETTFLQDASLKGRPAEQATYDASGNLYSKTVNTWNSTVLYTGVTFPYLTRKDNYVYDGDLTGRRTAETFFYEESPQLGNLTKAVQLGEVDLSTGADIGSDSRTVETAYVNNTTNWLFGLPRQVVIKNNAGTEIRKTWFYYDNNISNTALPTVGLLTKKEDWAGATGTNPVTQYAYTSYGNLASTTDARGNATSITYDTQYNMFPVLTTNALGHTVTTSYYGIAGVALNDGAGLQGLWGQVKSTTDPNGQTGYRLYDTFGRVRASIGPNDSVQYPSSTVDEIAFLSNHVRIKESKRVISGTSQVISSVAFADGLGRTIQAKSPSATVGQYVVSGQVAYNNRGQVIKKYLPVFSTAAVNDIVPIATDQKYASVTYDAMGRAVTSTNPNGTYSSATYSDWTTSGTDENGHMQKSYFDAYGRLITKEEYLGADGRTATYPQAAYTLYATTQYTYDSEGNLTQTQDAQGNITTIGYDALGRKTTMNDPDMGIWTYAYDLNGNLVSQTDAKNQTITFTYDVLNRLTNKTNGGTVNVSYTYDDPAVRFSKGRLTKVTYTGGQATFTYDNLGREIKSVKTVNGTDYTVERTYDALNNLRSVTYPDGENEFYHYNPAGGVDGVANDESKFYEQQSFLYGVKSQSGNEAKGQTKSSSVKDAKSQEASSSALVARDSLTRDALTLGTDSLTRDSLTRDSLTRDSLTRDSLTLDVVSRFTKYASRVFTDFVEPYILGVGTAAADGVAIDEKGHAVSVVGNPFLSTTEKKFGRSSMALDGDDYLTTPDSNDWDVFKSAGEQWSIDFWVKHTNPSAAAQQETYIGQYQSSTAYWSLYRKTNNAIECSVVYAAAGINIKITTAANVIVDTNWHYVLFVKMGATYAIYIDGFQKAFGFFPVARTFAGPLQIGQAGTGAARLNGYMDEVRLQKDIFNLGPIAPNPMLSNMVPVPPMAPWLSPSVRFLAHFDTVVAPALQTVTAADKQISVSWSAISGATGYKVKYGTTSGIYTYTVNTTATSYTFSNMVNGTTYYFVVSAYDPLGESPVSNELSAVPIDVPVMHSAVGNDDQITIQWESVPGATGYYLRYALKGTTYGDAVFVGTGTAYTVSGLHNGTSYAFQVAAENAYMRTAYSTAVTARPSADGTPDAAAKHITSVVYNVLGQTTRIEYGNGTVTQYTYDELASRLTRIYTVNASNVVLQDLNYTYDAVGNILAITDAVNTATQSFTYDALGRLTAATAAGSYGSKTFAYDTIGNLTLKDGKTYTYGAGSAGPHAVTGLSDGTTFTYDNNGNMATQVKSGETTAYVYDAENRLTSVTKAGQTLGQYTYDGDGGRTTKTSYASGGSGGTCFLAGTPVTMADGTTKPIEAVKIGENVLSFDEKSGSVVASAVSEVFNKEQASEYLLINGMLKVTGNHRFYVVERNENGEARRENGRPLPIDGGGEVGVTTASLSAVIPAEAGIQPASRGNWTEAADLKPGDKILGLDGQVITIDSIEKVSIAKPVAVYNLEVVGQHNYFAGGMLVHNKLIFGGAGTTTVFVGSLYEETNGVGTKSLFAGSNRFATLSDNKTYYFHTDHLGGTNVISDGAGAAKQIIEYMPYGEISRKDKIGSSEEIAWWYFTGQHLDDETGLYYYNARYYNPVLGRFIQADTIVQSPGNPQTLNRYSYCGNNPVNRIDPTGHKWSWTKFWHAAVGAIVGVVAAVVTAGLSIGFSVLAAQGFSAIGIGAWAVGGAIGGAITGGLDGGWKGALMGAAMGGAMGGLGGWVGGMKYGGWGMLAAGTGMAAATDSWDSFAGGITGGIVGSTFASGYLSLKYDGISLKSAKEIDPATNKNWRILGVGTTEKIALRESVENGGALSIFIKSRGPSDLVRAGFKKVGMSSKAGSELADLLLQASDGTTVFVHSEAALTLAEAMKQLSVDGKMLNNVLFDFNGAAISRTAAQNLTESVGGTMIGYHMNLFDPVAAVDTLNPIKIGIYGGIGLATLATTHKTSWY